MNVLVVGPHPDDQELAMGGTILQGAPAPSGEGGGARREGVG